MSLILKEPVCFLLGPYLMWATSNIKQKDWTDRELLGRGRALWGVN